MRNKWVLLIAALVLSLACTSQAIVVGDFEGGFDGWLPAGASTLTLTTTGATSGAGSLLIEGPGSWQMLAKLDIKSLRATLGVADAAVSIDVTAFAADMVTPWMYMEMIINGQNSDESGANNNIGSQSLGALAIVRDGAAQTLRWEVPDDLAAKIAGTDDNIQWFELFIVTNNAATNTKIYVDNIQLLGTEPEPELEPGPKIIWVSRHGADDAPSAGAASAGFTEAPDKGYTDLLTANGYDVTRYIGTGTPDVNVLNAADLVIIGRNNDAYGHYHYWSDSNAGAPTWNGISTPMIIMHGYTVQNCCMGYTTGGTMGQNMVDTTGDITLTVSDPTHPIFAGIPLTAGTMTNPYAGLAVYPTDGTTVTGGISIDNDPLNGGGTVLATVSAAGNGPVGGTVIAEWPAGATLTHAGGAGTGGPGTDTLGGHRLVFLTGARQASGKSVHTAGLYDLSADGEQMLLNAVKYMIPVKPEPEPEPGPKITWVSFHGADDAPSAGAWGNGFTQAPDKAYTDLLTANGYNVTRYITTGTPDPAVLNAADLVIISRSVPASSFQNAAATAWNTTITAPMIINASAIRADTMGFATGDTYAHITGDIKLTVNDPTHPIFTGIPVTDGTMTNPYAGVVVYPTDGTKAHGIMIATDAANANGTVLGTVSAAGNGPAGAMIIGEWPAGATLTHSGGAGTDVLAGPRLVFLTGSCQPAGKSAETAGMYDLYPDGAQMFLNAVKYMLK